MKRGVLQFTACCLAVGVTFTGASTIALASRDTTLAGFGGYDTTSLKAVEGETEETFADEFAGETSVDDVHVDAVLDALEEALNDETELEDTEVYEEETFEDNDIEGTVSEEAGSEEAEAAEDSEEAELSEENEEEAEPVSAVADTSLKGQRAFAKCEEYINMRAAASADSEVVAKVYNNNAVTILEQEGDWYKVQSGNAVGYCKAEFFVVGEQAEALSKEVGYNVATVYPEALTVRSGASEDAEAIGTVYGSDELEVVEYEGDWMKVSIGGGAYGYINAYYVGYDTYYSTAETLEEEQARLDREWLDYLAQQEAERQAQEQAYLDAIAAQKAAAQQAQWDAEWQAQQNAWNAEYQAQEAAQQAANDVDAQYQAYLDAQAAADQACQGTDEQAVYDAAQEAEAAYQEYLNAIAAQDAAEQAAEDAAEYGTDDTVYEDSGVYYDDTTETYEDSGVYYDESYDEYYDDSTETYSEPVSSAGQQAANFAVQFVGNPYVWGGSSLTNGADCSGFTMSVMANFGVSLPHSAEAQAGYGTPVDMSNLQPGDLLFYNGGGGIGHVTMYIGNGQVVHASSSTTGIIISDVGYRTPCCARRYL